MLLNTLPVRDGTRTQWDESKRVGRKPQAEDGVEKREVTGARLQQG
jgi:hypothetical protein